MTAEPTDILSAFQLVLQFLWFFLIVLAGIFLALEVRCRFDRSFLYHSGALFLLCGFTGVDLWILPTAGPAQALQVVRIQHLCFLYFSCFTLINVINLVGESHPKMVRGFLVAAMMMSTLAFTPPVLKLVGGKLETGWLYLPLFGTFLPITMGILFTLIVRGIRKAQASDRMPLKTHLFGLIILALGGLLDLLGAAFPEYHVLPSFTLLGALVYGLTVSSIFMEKFLLVLKDRQRAHQKLQDAYSELERANSLKEIGESTAIINHEIKNYMFMIAGNAQLLHEMEKLTPKGRDLVNNILSGVDKLNHFSRDILEMSKTRIIVDKHPINLSNLLQEVVGRHYGNRRHYFDLSQVPAEVQIHGDWHRLEQVLVNLFNNAIESAVTGESPNIALKLTASRSVVILTVEDSGIGCTKENMDKLFMAFFTTKKQKGGTGLGLSITRNIIESHGGRISAYSKNLLPGQGHGVKFQITFPNFSDDALNSAGFLAPVAVVTAGFEGLDKLLQLFRNVCLNPVVLPEYEDLVQRQNELGDCLVFTSPKTIHSFPSKLPAGIRIGLVSMHDGYLFMHQGGREGAPEPLTEEFILKALSERTGKSKRPALVGAGKDWNSGWR